MLTSLDIAQSTDILTVLEQQLTERLLPLQELGLGIINSPVQPQARMWGHALIYFTDLSSPQSGADKSILNSSLNYTIAVKIEEMRTHQTSYPFLMEIISRVQNFAPNYQPSGRMQHPSRFQLQGINYSPFAEGEGLVWTYDMTFSINVGMQIPRI